MRAFLSTEGAECKSLGQRPRLDVDWNPSAESAQYEELFRPRRRRSSRILPKNISPSGRPQRGAV